MAKVPRFSIVTPSLNQAGFIGETIESVLRQVGEFEIEYSQDILTDTPKGQAIGRGMLRSLMMNHGGTCSTLKLGYAW